MKNTSQLFHTINFLNMFYAINRISDAYNHIVNGRSIESNTEEPCAASYRDPATEDKTPQCSVVSVYRAMIGGAPHNVTVVWSKNLMNHSLSVSVEQSNGDKALTCRVDLKPWPFWSKKGSKSIDVDGGKHIDVFWNLRSAKFSDGPEPSEGYYVAIVCDDEVVLLLGDLKKKAYKKSRSRPSLEDAALVSKKENVIGKKCFAARTRFDDKNKKEHDIIVVNSVSGQDDEEAEMSISIDGIVLIHVSNLQWKFRGNETVLVEQVPVQVFWDVHDWLFRSPGSGHALFMFKPGLPDLPAEEGRGGGGEAESALAGGHVGGGGSSEFCFFLYAWKME